MNPEVIAINWVIARHPFIRWLSLSADLHRPINTHFILLKVIKGDVIINDVLFKYSTSSAEMSVQWSEQKVKQCQ